MAFTGLVIVFLTLSVMVLQAESKLRKCDKPVYPAAHSHVRTKSRSRLLYPRGKIQSDVTPHLGRLIRQDEKKGWVITQSVKHQTTRESIPTYWKTLCPEKRKIFRVKTLVHHDGGYCWTFERFPRYRYPYIECKTKICRFEKSYPWLIYACFPENFRQFRIWLWCPHSNKRIQSFYIRLSQACGCRRHLCKTGIHE